MTQTVDKPLTPLPLRQRVLYTTLLGRPPSDRVWGWLAPLIVTAVGGFLRFWRLNRPDELVFDETYYVKEAASYLKAGYELANKPELKTPDKFFTVGKTDVFATNPDFVVHPPVGKWMIAGGERLFGVANPWGWRFAAALVGTLSILMIARIGRRLFHSTLLGTTAALLLAVDGQHFVHSRTSLLDIFVMFWALAAFGCLVIDRDRARHRLATRLETGPTRRLGPWLGLRWWRVAGVVCLGLCIGTKWSGLYFAAAFLMMSVLWDISARRAGGVRHWPAAGLLLDGAQAFFTALIVLPAVYLASWIGWFRSADGYDRKWGTEHPSSAFSWVPSSLRSLLHYHSEMWNFHVNLHTPHVYQSNPWSWTVLGRPTAFFYASVPQGKGGCPVTECSRAITALGNPVIWWGGTIAIAVLLVRWAFARDWRAGAILAGLVGGYLPWFQYQERTIFTFYAVAFVPWVVLGLTYCLGLILGPADASERRRSAGALTAGAVVLCAVLAFTFFYPILAAQVLPRSSWSDRMWLPSWI